MSVVFLILLQITAGLYLQFFDRIGKNLNERRKVKLSKLRYTLWVYPSLELLILTTFSEENKEKNKLIMVL